METSLPGTSDSPTPEAPRLSRAERREKAVADALRALIRDNHLDRFGAVMPEKADLSLHIDLRVQPEAGWAVSFIPPLSEQVARQIDDARALHGAYRAGYVHCFRCESAACVHATPPSASSVFKGYAETGLPEWQDLHQAFVTARDGRVGLLFDSRPHVLALVQLGHELRARQLSTFGRSSRTYALLGQVVTGYLMLPQQTARLDSSRRLALTFQVVEIREPHGRIGVRLNTLAGLGTGLDLDELLASDWEPWVYRARELAARAIEDIERRVQAASEGNRPDDIQVAMRRIPSVLRRLAEFLERGHRQGQRRTRHVENRRHDQRPVHKALEDAREAVSESVFRDERTGTMVVCGPQGRAHVFNDAGRHVTSFTLTPDAVAVRLRTQRWRRATPDEAASVRQWSRDISKGDHVVSDES